MKGSGLFSVLSSLLLLFVACSSAFPWWPVSGHDAGALLLPRQDQNSNTASATNSNSNSGTATTGRSASNTASSTITRSASLSASGSASRSGSRSGSGSQTNATRTTSSRTTPIDPRLPPGGVALITPAIIDGPQYYRVGDFVTFQWNYTSLSVTPSAVDVLASCSLNSATYTIAANMSVEETGAVTWDTGEMGATVSNPFPVASYTLIIHDANQDITDVPSAGFLGAYQQYVFGMYTGQPYTPLNEFRCATCSGALSIHEKQAIGVLLTTAALTVVSFTWFASNFGVFS